MRVMAFGINFMDIDIIRLFIVMVVIFKQLFLIKMLFYSIIIFVLNNIYGSTLFMKCVANLQKLGMF